jgi:hypothetical protein
MDSDLVEYKNKRNEVNITIRRAKANYHRNLLDENSSDPSKFWKNLKSIFPNKSEKLYTARSLFEIDGAKTADAHKISNGFCSFFTSIISTIKEKAIPLRNFVWRFPASIRKRTETDINFEFEPVNKMEVEKLLKSVKRSKATGIDDLPPGLIKDSAPVISGPLTNIINLSLQSGLFPNDWKMAKIMPIHKSGSFSNFDHYRPISILPVMSKVIEKIIHHQVMKYLSTTGLRRKND